MHAATSVPLAAPGSTRFDSSRDRFGHAFFRLGGGRELACLEEGVATMSVGEGQYRQVVVVPESAPEYEEAQNQSRAASESLD